MSLLGSPFWSKNKSYLNKNKHASFQIIFNFFSYAVSIKIKNSIKNNHTKKTMWPKTNNKIKVNSSRSTKKLKFSDLYIKITMSNMFKEIKDKTESFEEKIEII